MCGLAGYVGLDEQAGRPLLQRMADIQAHRGPDGHGYFAAGRVGLAHRRLAIVDREGGEQPMYSSEHARGAEGRYVLVYNGEVYNFRELRNQLTRLGHKFRTASDTEVVLAAWVQWGEAAFDRFNGMFALAIADTETGEVILARDQFGIKPLYVAKVATGQVFFASEIRPLLATDLVERRPDDVTVYRYLRFRVHDDTERTFFAGIRRLMPGEMACISPDGQVNYRTYTSLYSNLRSLAANPLRYDDGARALVSHQLKRAIRRRLISDVPVGTALSGGLDSSTVVTTIDRMLRASDAEAAAVGARQHTFSAVFPGEINDEERYVDAVAGVCDDSLLVHKVKPNPDEFLLDLLDFVRTQEEPVISTAPYAQYCVMREASRHVTVMLDGQGADEMLAGYAPYYLVHLRDLRRRGHSGQAAVELLRSLDVFWRLGRFKVADALRGRRSVPVARLLSGSFVAAHRDERFPVKPDDIKARLEDDLFRHSLPCLLRYEDRNTMRFSIEGRVPFLDQDLLRTLWSVDSSAIIHHGWNKRALRDVTADLLPPLVHRRRNKIGFTTPEEAWFNRIKNYVYGVFASESFGQRPYFDQKAVLAAFEALVRGRASADTMNFWRLLNLELWLREFIDVAQAVTVHAAPPSTLEREPGRHPQAPPKSDYLPNDGKDLTLAGGQWARFPLRTDLIAAGDDVPALAARRVGDFFGGLPQASAEARRLAGSGRWYLFISEKIVAIAQGRSFFTWQVTPRPAARLLSRFVVRTPFGIGLGHPVTMQLAIDEVGLPKILAAATVGAIGKALGRQGWFYRVAGPAVRAIDGPTVYSAYPANVSAKLAPKNPAGVAAVVSAVLRVTLPAQLTARFGGTVIIDANDLGCNVLGHDTDLTDLELASAFADNPLGQGREQTPFAIVTDHRNIAVTIPARPVPARHGYGLSERDLAEMDAGSAVQPAEQP